MSELNVEVLRDEIMEDVNEIFGSNEFKALAADLRGEIEDNRVALTDILRGIPSFIEGAKRGIKGGEEPEVLLSFSIEGDAGFGKGPKETMHHPSCEEAMEALAVRCQLYMRATCCRACEVMLMSDGEELIRFTWEPRLRDEPIRVYSSSWSREQTGGKFPHDRIEYLVGTGLLYRRWMQDVMVLPSCVVTLKNGRSGALPFLPPKAAMLDAVDRWPVVFYAPKYLKGQLDEVVSVVA